MDTLRQFFEMGGYALYVWSAYGVSAVVLAALVLASRWRLRRLERELGRLESMEADA
jgi:heme exporter protein D